MLLTPKQSEFVRRATHRWNFKGGATRSGKTYLDFKWIIPMRIRERIGADGLVVLLGVTKSTIERNVLEPMRKIYGDKLVGDISSDNTVELFGEECYALGAEKVNQVSKIRGASFKYVYGDEVADWSEDVFALLKSRLDKPYSCFDGTYNPAYPGHWLKQFLDSDVDIYSQNYCIDDNPFLPPEFVQNLKREYMGTVFYDRYILGKWVKAEGLIYPFFDESKCTDAVIPPHMPGWEFYISCDYGTLNPCAMQLWAVSLRDRQAVMMNEYYYSGRDGQNAQRTDSEYYDALVELVGDYPIRSVVIDPSAASFIAEIRHRGRFSVRKANNDVVEGIRRTGALIKAGRILINNRCEATKKEFGLYSWDEKSDSDKPIKKDDHAMDAMRYLAYTILRPMGW
jgi:PBSX family phage terminase large subunit